MSQDPAQTSSLTDSEQEFADKFLAYGLALEDLMLAGQKVKADGGDARAAAYSTMPDDDMRAAFAMQWPIIAMMLGL